MYVYPGSLQLNEWMMFLFDFAGNSDDAENVTIGMYELGKGEEVMAVLDKINSRQLPDEMVYRLIEQA